VSDDYAKPNRRIGRQSPHLCASKAGPRAYIARKASGPSRIRWRTNVFDGCTTPRACPTSFHTTTPMGRLMWGAAVEGHRHPLIPHRHSFSGVISGGGLMRAMGTTMEQMRERFIHG